MPLLFKRKQKQQDNSQLSDAELSPRAEWLATGKVPPFKAKSLRKQFKDAEKLDQLFDEKAMKAIQQRFKSLVESADNCASIEDILNMPELCFNPYVELVMDWIRKMRGRAFEQLSQKQVDVAETKADTNNSLNDEKNSNKDKNVETQAEHKKNSSRTKTNEQVIDETKESLASPKLVQPAQTGEYSMPQLPQDRVDFDLLIRTLNLFHRDTPKQKKLKVAFGVFDRNMNGFVGVQDMVHVWRLVYPRLSVRVLEEQAKEVFMLSNATDKEHEHHSDDDDSDSDAQATDDTQQSNGLDFELFCTIVGESSIAQYFTINYG